MDRARRLPAAEAVVVEEVVSPKTRRKECSRRAMAARVQSSFGNLLGEIICSINAQTQIHFAAPGKDPLGPSLPGFPSPFTGEDPSMA